MNKLCNATFQPVETNNKITVQMGSNYSYTKCGKKIYVGYEVKFYTPHAVKKGNKNNVGSPTYNLTSPVQTMPFQYKNLVIVKLEIF